MQFAKEGKSNRGPGLDQLVFNPLMSDAVLHYGSPRRHLLLLKRSAPNETASLRAHFSHNQASRIITLPKKKICTYRDWEIDARNTFQCAQCN